MRIWWRQTTWVALMPITTHIPSFINVAHTELWIFDFFISQSEQICKWGIKYVHSVTTDHVGSTCVPHCPHTKFDENRSLHSHLRAKVYLLMLTRSYISTYIHTYIHQYRQRYNWKLSAPSSIAGGPQKATRKFVIQNAMRAFFFFLFDLNFSIDSIMFLNTNHMIVCTMLSDHKGKVSQTQVVLRKNK